MILSTGFLKKGEKRKGMSLNDLHSTFHTSSIKHIINLQHLALIVSRDMSIKV